MPTIIYAILSFTFIVPSIICKNVTPKIAIVGGGIGGTSCAYFLNKVFEGKAQLTLYEKDIIGGRLGLLNIDGDLYESGGSVIHPTNKHMMDFTKLLGLSLRKPPASHFGIFDGKEFVFRESDWYFLTLGKFLWRYGFAFLDLWKEVKSILEDFSSIYALQEKEYSFTTVNGLLEYMSPSFRNLTQESIGSYLMKKGYPKLLLEELVQSVMMVNYGQTNNMSAFAGFVSLAGADNNLWSVKGGNKMVPEGLLKESKASVVSGDVLEIINSGDTFLLKYNETSPPANTEEQNYDIIVIAAPFIKGNKNIKFTDFNKDFSQYETIYHRTVATFVKGDLNPSALNVNSVPEEILTFKNSLLFNSIGKVTPVTDTPTKGKKNVYKVFSQQPLTSKNIDELFQNVEILKEKDWLAYPEYKPPEALSPFMLYPGLYYINSIELSASAMEMSAVAGKNVALLAFNMWHNLVDKVDSHKRVYKDEL